MSSRNAPLQWGGALRDETLRDDSKNGGVGDYTSTGIRDFQRLMGGGWRGGGGGGVAAR